MKIKNSSLLVAICLGVSTSSFAEISLYDKEGTSFSVDGHFNLFYSQSEIEDAAGNTKDQNRIREGLLPNILGFNFSKEHNGLKFGGRSAFMIHLNDTDLTRGSPVETGIDIRQFYATVSGDFGQVLIGKNYSLYGLANILNDEFLLGHGGGSGAIIESGYVSFGNIGTGYPYPVPNTQITYSTNDFNGFKFSIGLHDARKISQDSEEDTPRVEYELTYGTDFEGGSFKAWLNGASQSSENGNGTEDGTGFGYGANIKFGGFSLTGSGYTSEGIHHAVNSIALAEADDADGYLVQGSYSFGDHKIAVSYGESELDQLGEDKQLFTNSQVGWIYKVNPFFTTLVEFNVTEQENDVTGARVEEVSTFSIGTVITF